MAQRTRKPESGTSKLFKLLKDDHAKVMELFEEVEENGSSGESAKEIFSQIQKELQIHMEGEEKYFYPILEKHEEAKQEVLEGFEEHDVVKTMLKSFEKVSPGNDRWMAKMKVLKEIVEHHVKEEEKEMFKLARKALDKEQAQDIAESIEAAKEEETA